MDAELEAFVGSCFTRARADESNDLADLMERLTPMLAERRDLVRVWSSADLATQLHRSASQRGRSWIDAAIRQVAPDLPADECERVVAALRQVVTLRAMLTLTQAF